FWEYIQRIISSENTLKYSDLIDLSFQYINLRSLPSNLHRIAPSPLYPIYEVPQLRPEQVLP
ncbi:hypothetical protein LC605_31615, partial [Nostoc sp. CHAB 5836]|uniref:hypothetical protein n=1 Tax=Nostoc sp. CHAB 5836 TaxID=2780404 RepID=UPI001E64831B